MSSVDRLFGYYEQRGAAMAHMTNAFNALYAALTPEQKTIADGSPRHALRSARRLTLSGSGRASAPTFCLRHFYRIV